MGNGIEVADNVVLALEKRNLLIATMESCTAGLISSMIMDTEGASAIFKGG